MSIEPVTLEGWVSIAPVTLEGWECKETTLVDLLVYLSGYQGRGHSIRHFSFNIYIVVISCGTVMHGEFLSNSLKH